MESLVGILKRILIKPTIRNNIPRKQFFKQLCYFWVMSYYFLNIRFGTDKVQLFK